ncbi:hypothetical protein CONPUDRAFT_140129 [Coniophora puteana RWD-64-598 SS2]|uniref:Uncharacterized protein n=1 Tax=Coniophora puteana (strain RWD-64-598) TaxID=741705 RepID=A0A5M3M7W4_CONPW|nr:uncharacterized protein CONPUDRAFT_140129 [Coniophora puteana RWD-64-598 SS2]EIW75137.1 hypothetical protein CONPUDRAFT_140129 [Coniophora puteana RWD-64-598 SS2]
MAQAVFHEHPLEEYLEETDDLFDTMPGGSPDLTPSTQDAIPHLLKNSEHLEKLCFLIFGAVELVSSFFSPERSSKRAQAFAERFKYGVISSSLLVSSTFSSTPAPSRRSFSPSFPGKLQHGTHSRNTSTADSTLADTSPVDKFSTSVAAEADTPLWPVTSLASVAIAAFSAGFYAFAVMFICGTLYYVYAHKLDLHTRPDVVTPSLEALKSLISAGEVWDSVVHDTLDAIENEERAMLYGSLAPTSPSSPLRVALNSSLHTTQTQCDNIRQLFSAITSPTELSQMTEMYAPSSPTIATLSLGDSPRPLSLPSKRERATSISDNKRATWNGSYAALARAGAPPVQLARRRSGKRRSDMSALLEASTPSRPSSISAPASPSAGGDLPGVQEESNTSLDPEKRGLGQDGDDPENYFGLAALQMKRQTRSDGLQNLLLSSSDKRTSMSSLSSTTVHSRTSPSLSPLGRYATKQKQKQKNMSRHPLSVASLHQALSGALAAKRYTCSHLLALRFEDDEDETYWEDVRSVMSLLTSSLVDAAARLGEALDSEEYGDTIDADAVSDGSLEGRHGLSANHSPASSTSPTPSRRHAQLPSLSQGLVVASNNATAGASLGSPGFAPMPSHIARFAGHMDAITAALDDARSNLEECVAALRRDALNPSPSHSRHASSTSSAPPPSPAEHAAVQAYERVRRELGIALRECERGREPLLCAVVPPPPSPDSEADDLPILGPDLGSDESHEEPSPVAESSLHHRHQRSLSQHGDIGLTVVTPEGDAVDLDDTRLLRAERLEPPGVEQVFEAEVGAGLTWARERSKMSREERIKLVKAKRESAAAGLGIRSNAGAEAEAEEVARLRKELWGPGGEVVQELKDVIYKVGERRRRMTEEARATRQGTPSPVSAPAPALVFTPDVSSIWAPEDVPLPTSPSPSPSP